MDLYNHSSLSTILSMAEIGIGIALLIAFAVRRCVRPVRNSGTIPLLGRDFSRVMYKVTNLAGSLLFSGLLFIICGCVQLLFTTLLFHSTVTPMKSLTDELSSFLASV